MALTRDVTTNEQNKFVESTTVSGQPVIPVANADGTPLSVSINTSDIQLGAVEIKNATSDVRATVRDLAANDALNVAIVDGAGDQITSFGGGTQYTEGATDATITGTVAMWEDGADTVVATSAAKPLPVEIIAGAGSGGTAAADDADFTAGTTSGTPAQGVYESTPTTVTDGDLGTVGITAARRLKTSTTVDAALPAGTNNIGDVDVLSSALPTGASTSAKQDTLIGHVDGIEALLTTIDADTSNLSVVGGGTEAAAIRVTLASDSTGLVSIDDNGSSITVDGTVAVTNAGLTELAAAVNASSQMDVNIAASNATLTVASHAVTNAGTFAVQSTNQTGDNTIGRIKLTDGTDVADILDLTNSNPLTVAIVDTSGDQISSFGGGTQYTEDAAAAANPVATALNLIRADSLAGVTTTDGDNLAARGTDKGELYVKHVDAIPVTDNGGALTVDGTVAVTQSGTWDEVGINDSGNSITVDNAQLSVVGSGTEATAMRVTIATDSTGVLSVDDNGGALTVDGTVTADLGATDNAVLDAIAASTAAIETAVEGTLTVTGGGGGTEYTEDAAAAANPVGNALLLIREDGRAGSLTTTDGDNVALRGNNKGEAYVKTTDSDALLTTIDVDTSNISTKIDTVAGAVSGTEVQVDVLTMPTVTVNAHAVTNAGTFVTQENGALLTSSQLIDDTVYIDDADWTDGTSKHNLVGGLYQSTPQTVTDGDVAPFNITANGALHVSDAGGSLTVDGTVAVTGVSTLAEQQTQTTHLATIAGDTTSIQTAVETIDNAISGTEMQVDVVAALPAGDNNIGNVDIVSGTITTVSTVTSVTAIANALPAGTNAIGKLAANSGVDIGDVDVTSLPALAAGTNAVGKLLPPDIDVTTHTNYAKKYYTSTGAATDGIIWSPAAGKRWHVVSLFINVSAAATVTLEDDLGAGDSAVMKMELAANSGIMIPFGEDYPLASGEDAADLIITTSAGNVYVTCVGYEI